MTIREALKIFRKEDSNYWLDLFYGPEMDFDPDGEDGEAMKGDDSNGD